MSPRVLIHLGMHKTGSSWLQEHLFGRAGTGFWTNASPDLSPKHRAKAHSWGFMRGPDGGMLESAEFDAGRMRDEIRLADVPADQCAIISAERFSGHPLSNGIDREAICERLKAVVPDARILLVIREQRSMILSSYMQYLRSGGGSTVAGYLCPKVNGHMPSLSMNFWKYDRLIRLYADAFGLSQLLVLPYEFFVAHPGQFVDRVCAFAGIPATAGLPFGERANASGGYFSHYHLRRAYLPALLGRHRSNVAHEWLQTKLNAIVPARLDERTKRRLQEQIEEIVGDTYAQSNQATQDLTGLDLGSYGYVMRERESPHRREGRLGVVAAESRA